jgi:hypothetical protein
MGKHIRCIRYSGCDLFATVAWTAALLPIESSISQPAVVQLVLLYHTICRLAQLVQQQDA